jgi:hypothetical protein
MRLLVLAGRKQQVDVLGVEEGCVQRVSFVEEGEADVVVSSDGF